MGHQWMVQPMLPIQTMTAQDMESQTMLSQRPWMISQTQTFENSDLAKEPFSKVQTSSRRKEREPKNWEFLMRLLVNPLANPKIIRWEDKDQATFRLIHPEVITQLWNARSTKTNVTYKNFARGLRYHYTTGALVAVCERQLVYGCGPKALEFLDKLGD
ncbi:unnamed protein product, partial [Meganyctiphanes norvegica]